MNHGQPLRLILGVALLLLSGCDAAQNARNDFARATSAIASATRSDPAPAPAPARKVEAKASGMTKTEDSPNHDASQQETSRDVAAAATSQSLVGRSEGEIRALLGPPTSEEDRAPGKTWHYRDGQCTVDVQLYPDVQTRQFGTLAYEVKSNDSTDEGKRLCLAQLKSRTQAKGD
jgi:hypothetical protein